MKRAEHRIVFKFGCDHVKGGTGLSGKPVDKDVERIRCVLGKDEVVGRAGMKKCCKGFSGGGQVVCRPVPGRPARFVQRQAQAAGNFKKNVGGLRPRRRSIVEVDERGLFVLRCGIHWDELCYASSLFF